MKAKSRSSRKAQSPAYFPWRPHPWHGISTGKNPPSLVNAYIEITPFDGIKYEIDKETGYLKVDRPQMSSALPPALYGFIPRTYCGKRVGSLSIKARRGDGDPLDICVLSERAISRSEVIVPVRVIGGFRMVDRSEADDKIIAVLENDPYWSDVRELAELSPVLRQRLEHYFSTYKLLPGQKNVVSVEAKYGMKAAWKVIEASRKDYQEAFPVIEES
ncbi:MAG: inorganic pyrophosphatase [Bdellovibrionales bacterium GWB1_55_8]|nr:MAG: inorganic pyrophosphatase [Bdellovibrionales bacterium GWB1_55_8]